jgi:hypothetical protein
MRNRQKKPDYHFLTRNANIGDRPAADEAAAAKSGVMLIDGAKRSRKQLFRL